MESLDAADPSTPNSLRINKLQPLANLGNIQLNSADIAAAQQHTWQHMQSVTTLVVLKDPVINEALPSICYILRLALKFRASSASCESNFSMLIRVLMDYRRLMLHEHLSRLVLLAFEQDKNSTNLHGQRCTSAHVWQYDSSSSAADPKLMSSLWGSVTKLWYFAVLRNRQICPVLFMFKCWKAFSFRGWPLNRGSSLEPHSRPPL